MSRTILDLHVLQTVPPSNLNRDDTGTPKTAFYGGVRRSRVSSQAWKRATRKAFADLLDPSELGVRTKKVAELIGETIRELDETIDQAESWELASAVVEAGTGSKLAVPKRKKNKNKEEKEEAENAAEPAPESSYLMFLSASQRRGLAELAIEGRSDIKAFLKDKENKARARQVADSRHSIDIALFGRMVADGADVNVDAAAQVAHAISVHAVETESDYYTAVDDRNEDAESGAGMIGTVEFNSATLYRYAALDVDRLADNLGQGLREDAAPGEPVRRAVEAFLRGFLISLPSGKVNTFAHNTLPEAVVVKLRGSRPVSFVGAFEEPTLVESGGHLRQASERLAEHIGELEAAYGEQAEHTWVLRVGGNTRKLDVVGPRVDLEELVTQVGTEVIRRQQGSDDR
ncbi:type I-E CRISPR-associated protein Cas7/Cse4/CasC [Streptomyces alkaliterrae]|uniref:Type I-E CRISPR-associated protein Cas7/Cse4/CasC n=1 Tax=Streptomyces alkaliterrae TaxID=2213162 RepID=A0A5P0YV32_9ACTN|nr:type I-E CRISPR-associated protein Cas7/Cse4/CasC [Streptomyces alkaliterrae]MBB1255660.1 type I-E CRISPR-associated protein Cas7/Cse4/CasC [Streptomyces alkaliterrae]MBB1261795.1 type I-E CRISPR-associated protein Cas7/Cse4/CasC [Streptomyces alkaliterrae]MQS04155.1 type I-E CRISPR-associated protein Cas7/Cse4/CasC [Streptomyces alkaliterrae]